MKTLMQRKMDEVCSEHRVTHETLRKYISEEWIRPFDIELLLFDDEDMVRVSLICELQEDMGVNDEAVLIILNLIDQVNYLRTNIISNKDKI